MTLSHSRRSYRPGARAAIAGLAFSGTVLVHAGCSSSSATSTATSAPDATTSPATLSGVYSATDGDSGASDPLAPTGDVVRFAGSRYSIHHVPCPAGTTFADDASVPDLSVADGCASFGSFAIATDGATLSMTDDATGQTTTVPFEVKGASGDDAGGGSIGLRGGIHTLGTGLGDGGAEGGVSLTGPSQSLASGNVVTLYKAGTQLFAALPCSGESTNLGADTGAMIRTATSTSFTCIQSRISFPVFDVPTGPDGQSYCTDFSQPGCTTANYYGRRGVPFIYYTFVSTDHLPGGRPPPGRAECGFSYQPGLANGSAQGNPRWTPYIRDTAGAYVYGVNADQRSGDTSTVWCGIESSGLVRMKINGAFVNMAGAGGATTPLTSNLSFAGHSVHAFRVTGLAWPETAPAKVTAAKANGTYFPAYTCQPMNQLGPVVYQDTLVCQGSSMVPAVKYVTAPGGNARWTAGGDGYTLSPSSEASETETGTTDTDLIFPGGG